MLKIFKRREDVFNKLILDQANLTFEGLKLLVKYLDNPTPDVSEELSLKEKEADVVVKGQRITYAIPVIYRYQPGVDF